VVRFPYENGDLVARAEPEEIIPDLPASGPLIGSGRWTRDLAFSKDGGALYVSVGSFSNDDDTDNNPQEMRRANVIEYSRCKPTACSIESLGRCRRPHQGGQSSRGARISRA
jgi:glucose/arabinose dehydrogenase